MPEAQVRVILDVEATVHGTDEATHAVAEESAWTLMSEPQVVPEYTFLTVVY